MVSGRTRRVVVIKDIPSNIIEEAIFILKAEQDGKSDKVVKETQNDKAEGHDLLIKEAQAIIDDYIKANRMGFYNENKRRNKRSLRKILWNSSVGMFFLGGSLVFLIFLITEFL